MQPPTVERRLSAILSADVAGYSRLMGDDESATVETLTAYRQVFAESIEQHRGRVVNAPGDALLAEFGSVVDAVACAVAVQHELAKRNRELPASRAMAYRIGVNLGDVIVNDTGIYGDGVNIAARLEAMAEAGGVNVSGSVHDSVKGKLPLEYEFLGEQQVKNIKEPVRTYRVINLETTPSIATRSREPAAEKQPQLSDGLPSIAVLPFVNMSGDPEQEYFSDGLTETIITTLSKLSNLLVIARNSTFIYKGKPTDVRQVSRELNVRYVLEGSVQKAGNRVRIAAQLIDATSGHHLWADHFDRDLDDIFALQDEITRNIVTELDVKLVSGEDTRAWRNPTNNPRAYDLFLRGMQAQNRGSKEGYARSRELFTEALDLDPEFVLAIVKLGVTHELEAFNQWSEAPSVSYEKAVTLAHRAIAIDDTNGYAHALLGHHLWIKEYDFEQAVAHGQKAVALEPNSAYVAGISGLILTWTGNADEGLMIVQKAMRINPIPTDQLLYLLGHAYFVLGRYDEAIQSYRRSLERFPESPICHRLLAIIYAETGREEEARAEAKKMLRIMPNFSVDDYGGFIKDTALRERMQAALRKAGVK